MLFRSKLDVFYLQDGNWQQVREETDHCLPIRHGRLGGELFNLASAVPPTNLFFPKIASQTTTEHTVDHRMETDTLRPELTNSKQQEEGFLATIHKLEEEYRQCQNEIKSLKEQLELVQKELSAKEDAIKIHRAETNTLRSGLTKSRIMEQEYRQCQNENKLLKEQLKQVQKKLSAKEDAIKIQRAETDTLRLELTKSKQQEEGLLATIRKMKKEMESRKGLLDKIFHKKE